MSNNDNGDGNTYTNGDNSFTAEQEELFKKRYEEGYDLFIDPDYVRWIKLHYPDFHLPTDSGLICDLFTDVVPVSPIAIFENSRSPCSFNQSSSITEMEQLTSFMDIGISTLLSDRVSGTITQSQNAENTIVTASPVSGTITQSQNSENTIVTASPVSGIVTQSQDTENTTFKASPVSEILTQSQNAENIIITCIASPVSGIVIQSQNTENTTFTASPVSGIVTQSQNAENIIITASPVSGTITQRQNPKSTSITSGTPTTSTSPLADYLVHPVQSTTISTPTAPKRSVPRAKLLTSDESLALLEQKENAKKAALLEKEKRKIE